MSVLEGARMFTEGETVQAGDVIVSGVMDSIASGNGRCTPWRRSRPDMV